MILALCNVVEKYIATAKGLPFFYVVGDNQYSDTLSELRQHGFQVDRVSDFCQKEDKFPNIDDIIDHFRTLDVDYKQNKHVLVGLGELLALKGSVVADEELRRLKDTTLGTARIVLLLRCVTAQVRSLVAEDNRLVQQQRAYFEENALSSLAVSSIKYSLKTDVSKGVKGLLKTFEDGAIGTCSVNSIMTFPNSLLPVSYINSACAAIHHAWPYLSLEEKMGTEQQWDQLFQTLSKNNGALDTIFDRQGFTDDFEQDLYQNCAGLEFKNWLFFLYLKQNVDSIRNAYLQYVLSVTDCYEKLKDNILTEIIRIPRKDKRFRTYYDDRKRLIRDFPETDIAIFIHENRIDPQESIYRFTDNTQREREEIINWVSVYGYVSEIEYVYPALNQYLGDYIFDCGKLSDELTSYFKDYKMQKITNCIYPEFLERVNANAKSLPYTHLETRDSAILRIEDKKSAFLYWIDALGVEYLAYITALVRKKGLSMHVDIAYSELPTITSINRGFYENWPGAKKEKESDLDDIKHKEKGGFVFDEAHQAPVHLASELKVIERAIDRAATELAMHNCRSFVIASDHGASRLAVIRRQEEKYETDTKGEHSGRCCKEFPDADLPYAVKENGYYVLADYGRFKKSRAANVEVHGGASLEEVLVPVITLTLRKQSTLDIRIVNEADIRADRKIGTQIVLYISGIENPNNVSVVIDSERYLAVRNDSTHFTVILSQQRRSKKNVSAAIYDGDDLIGNVTFDIKGKFDSAEKKVFDDLDF